MALSRIATVLGGLLLSRSGRRFAGRHAGKLALATLAWELYQQQRNRGGPTARTDLGDEHLRAADAKPHARRRWSGRRT